jgi:hypothetical protein
MLDFFETRAHGRLPPLLYRAALQSWALVRLWDAPAGRATERGRAFETAFYETCNRSGFAIIERAGSRTLCSVPSASGLRHESDAVIAGGNLLIHVELKHTVEVSKATLMEFNQKGLDFVMSGALVLQRRPLYRMLVSGGPLAREARRFAALWGIIVIEPDVLPLPLLHWLAGSTFPAAANDENLALRIWREVPIAISSIQESIRRLPECLTESGCVVAPCRIDALLEQLQHDFGTSYWHLLDALDPYWLERIYAKERFLSASEGRRSKHHRQR